MRKSEPLERSGVFSYVRFLVGLSLALALMTRAHAQEAAIEELHRMIDADPFVGEGDDPLARDEALRAMSLPETNDVVERRVPPQVGEVLTAIPGVRETAHRTQITLRDGLALVEEELHFESHARVPAEVRYRLSVPEGAVLVDTTAHAETIRDDRGFAIDVRASPLMPRAEPLALRVRWAMRTPVRGGHVRFVLPARGNDARIVPMELSVRATDLVMPLLDGRPIDARHQVYSPTAPITVEAELPMTAALSVSGWVSSGESGRAVRLRVVAPRPEIALGDVIVAIDASPSTLLTARGRIAPTARVLLSMLPSNARVRVVTFASRARELSDGWSSPAQIASLPLERAVDQDLGPATRFESLWAELEPWVTRDARLVIIGDGGLSESETAGPAFAAAIDAGVAIRSVNVADRATTGPLRGAIERVSGVAIDVGREAEEAAAGRDRRALVARLSSLVARTTARRVSVLLGSRRIDLGPVASGEERVWEGELEPRRRVIFEVDGAQHRVHAAEPGLASALVALARVERDESRPSERLCPGLPPETLLYSLRRRVMPAARACFRDDRRGRASYQARALMRFELGDREIMLAEVEGSMSASLRRCLLAALDRVEVPGFIGRVRAHWPLYTEAVMTPPVLELWSDVADQVDRITQESEVDP